MSGTRSYHAGLAAEAASPPNAPLIEVLLAGLQLTMISKMPAIKVTEDLIEVLISSRSFNLS